VLMVLDEFPAIGRIPIIAEASGFLPGYNVRTLMIMQTPTQLKEVYGENGSRTLLKTLAGRIYFQPKQMDDAAEISHELGDTTVKVKTHSRPLWQLSGGKSTRHPTVSISEQKRPLMLAQEVRHLGRGREIIFTEDTPPILCGKIRYYTMPALCERIRKPPKVPEIELRPERLALRHESFKVVSGPQAPTGEREGAGQESLDAAAPRVHEATVEDVDRADELTEKDFEVDFSKTVVPEHEGPMTVPEMWTAVTSYVDSLHP
jgi:type IV secretion system protein VirD4